MSDLTFTVIGARAELYAAVPTLLLRLKIDETSGEEIQMIALRCQIQIEVKRRRYSPDEETGLLGLFGEPHRWGDTLHPILWTHVPFMVRGFKGSVEVDIPIVCTYDLELASTQYFRSLKDGEIPLLVQFSGTVFTRGGTGFQVEQVSWAKEARYRLPVSIWRELLDQYFPGTGWLRLRQDNIDALVEFKGRRALLTWDDVVKTLLADAERAAEPAERV
jgi:hypothetical protein